MNKLPDKEKFFDFSDYSRPFSKILVNRIKDSKISPLHFTTFSLISGLFAALLIYLNKYNFLSALLILAKSFFDAVDGELARARNRPSYVGRFYDSVVDFFVNVAVFLSLTLRFNESLLKFLLIVLLFHLQGSIYNYYYVLKRHKAGGDTTSHINEKKITSIYPYDNPFWFNVFHKLYLWIYSWQDEIVYRLDKSAENLSNIPNSFMTLVSLLGLGTQLLIISFLIIMHQEKLIFPIFIYYYSIFSVLVILFRKIIWKSASESM